METQGVGMSDLSNSENHDTAPINQSSYPQFPLPCVLISLCACLIKTVTDQLYHKLEPKQNHGPLQIAAPFFLCVF